jgi:hyperpolarization activated cyclic nucleotide-gated potassium channel 2
MFIIIYQMIIIPFQMSFDDGTNPAFNKFNGLDDDIDYIFLTDIFLNFSTAIYLKGVPCFRRTVIAKKYLQFWFWMDLLSSFPYDIVLDAVVD